VTATETGRADVLAGLDERLRARDAKRDFALIALYLVALAWTWLVVFGVGPRYANGWLGLDAAAYHQAWSHDLYGPLGPGVRRYLYSPVFAQIIWPLAQLPWRAFVLLWTAMVAFIFWWLLRPVPFVWRVPLFLILCLDEVILGNVRALMALALVFSVSQPGWWAVMILTKPATGVGILYYPLRSEWGALLRALGWTLGLAGLSAVIAPVLWRSWLEFLTSGSVVPTFGFPVFVMRLVVAVGMVVVAARKDRYWLVVIAVALASPVINPPSEISLLAAIPRMLPKRAPIGEPVEGKRSGTSGAEPEVEST
jgi:hypothetical protein